MIRLIVVIFVTIGVMHQVGARNNFTMTENACKSMRANYYEARITSYDSMEIYAECKQNIQQINTRSCLTRDCISAPDTSNDKFGEVIYW